MQAIFIALWSFAHAAIYSIFVIPLQTEILSQKW